MFVNGLKQKKWLDVLDLNSDTIFFVQQTKYNVLSFDLKKLLNAPPAEDSMLGLQGWSSRSGHDHRGHRLRQDPDFVLGTRGGTQRFQQEMGDLPMIFQPRKG